MRVEGVPDPGSSGTLLYLSSRFDCMGERVSRFISLGLLVKIFAINQSFTQGWGSNLGGGYRVKTWGFRV